MKKVAVIYDFDKTLCTKDMQEYSLIPSLGYDEPGKFWKEVGNLSKGDHMDPISAYLYYLKVKMEASGKKLTREDFKDVGKTIELYPGVTDWFERLNRMGKELDLEVEHYVISSGMREIIEETEIADQFKKIYACRYYYDENGYAQWPAVIINYTTKTQYIFRINKQVLDENDDDTLNRYTPQDNRPVPFDRMIYIADGLTDVPCMKLVKEYGGKSIAVYNPNSAKAGFIAERLVREGRCNFITQADYRKGSEIESLIHMILQHMSIDGKLDDLSGFQK